MDDSKPWALSSWQPDRNLYRRVATVGQPLSWDCLLARRWTVQNWRKLFINNGTTSNHWGNSRSTLRFCRWPHAVREASTCLSPRSRVILWETSQEITRMLWNPKFHSHLHKDLLLVPYLNQLNPVHVLTSHSSTSILISSIYVYVFQFVLLLQLSPPKFFTNFSPCRCIIHFLD